MPGKPPHLNRVEFLAIKEEFLKLIALGHTVKSAFQTLKDDGKIEHLTYRTILKLHGGDKNAAQAQRNTPSTARGPKIVGQQSANKLDTASIWEK